MSRAKTSALGAALCLLLSAASAQAADTDLAPTANRSYAARVVTPTAVRTAPDASSRVRMRLTTRAPWTHGPVKLLVLEDRRHATGVRWLRVRLASRPNDADGWINADYVRLSVNPWRITVSTGTRTVRVYKAGKLLRRWRAVVGKLSTPTPHGLFAVYESARQPNPDGFLGPWALHLTAHSKVLENYGGGPGRVALHGRSGASLRDPLGTARSHGCIRVPNAGIRWLARTVSPGTPVRIGP